MLDDESRARSIVGRPRKLFTGPGHAKPLAPRSRSAATGQATKLHRPATHAGSSGPVGPAGSPDCRGWCSGKTKVDRTSEDAESVKTKPRKGIVPILVWVGQRSTS